MLQLKDNAVPVQKPLRRIPVAMRDEFQEAIDSMVKAGILTKLDKNQATEWLNSFVVVRKPSGKLRVSLDPTDLNPHIICPVFNSNTLDDIVHKLCKAKYMACFDALKGFFHVPLDENSELLTAMFRAIGVFIYNVLAMGLTNANDIFEQCLHDILHSLDGVFNIADDILVIGETYEEFRDNVIRFLDWCVEKYLHLNADKFKLDCDTVTFFGHLLTKNGMKPDPKKVKDIREWLVPKGIKELQSFLGAVNYLARFIPHLSALRAPLQDLLKKENELIWAQNYQLCFDQIKEAVCKDITLKFYDPNLLIFIEIDASQSGIGVVLLQPLDSNFPLNENNIPTKLMPVAFASKTLTSAECNYANIERELLGVVFGVLHFKHFTFSNEVNIITDHKPLMSLLKKSLATCSSRLSRLIL